MLTQVQGGTSARLVAFSTAGSSGAVRYTVPAGRTWRGHMWGSSSSSATFNGVTLNLTLNSTGSSSFPIPLTLPAGTVVADTSQSGLNFIGIEE